MFKRFILFFVVIAEFILCSFFLNNYYQKKLLEKKVLGIEKIAVIDKSKTAVVEHEDFKYYWRFLPNDNQKDKPEWLVEEAEYHINRDGLNDLYDYSIKKESNTFRIITLGDSLTFGHYVNTKDNWTELLEILLNDSTLECKYDDFEVINLGMPGFDIPYIVERYKEIGQKYDPDLILWFESGSGFDRYNEFLQPIIEKCNDEENTEEKALYFDCWGKAEKQFDKEYSLWDLSKIIENYYDAMFDLVDQKKVIIAYQYPLSKEEADISVMWQDKYPKVRFLPLISKLKEEELLPDSHPNKKGHKRIANDFFEYLKNDIKICDK